MSILDRAREFLTGHKKEQKSAPVDPVKMAKTAIERDQASIADFEGHIVDAIAELKRLEAERSPLQAEVDKWDRLKANAAAAGDEDSTRQAVEKKLVAKRRIEAVDARITEARQLRAELEDSLQEARDRLDVAAGKVPLQAAREAGAEMRERMAKSDVDGAQADTAEGAVAALGVDVTDKVAHAAAYEQMAATTAAGAGRVAERAPDVKAVDDEVKTAMAAAKKGG